MGTPIAAVVAYHFASQGKTHSCRYYLFSQSECKRVSVDGMLSQSSQKAYQAAQNGTNLACSASSISYTSSMLYSTHVADSVSKPSTAPECRGLVDQCRLPHLPASAVPTSTECTSNKKNKQISSSNQYTHAQRTITSSESLIALYRNRRTYLPFFSSRVSRLQNNKRIPSMRLFSAWSDSRAGLAR